jgi:hypothetical protein
MTIVISTDDSINFQSLAGIKASISARLDRDFDDNDLNDFIYLAEREMERVLTVPYREATTSVTVDGQTANLPNDFKALRRFTLLTDPKRNLQQVSPSVLDSNWSRSASGCPEAFAIISGQFWFSPVPDGTYAAQIVYEQKITALTESAPSNWLLQRHPDAYFYGALVQAADFIADTARIGLYRSAFDNVIAQINAEGVRHRYAASPFRLRSPVVA